MDSVNEDKNIGTTVEDRKTVQGWRPIESASKDADLLLLYDEQEGVRAGFWDAVELNPAAWIATETQGLTCGKIKPTHWMPLPEPPCLSGSEHGTDGQAS